MFPSSQVVKKKITILCHCWMNEMLMKMIRKFCYSEEGKIHKYHK